MRTYLALVGLLISLLLCTSALASKNSMCPSNPIRFGHYEMGALYMSGIGGIDEDLLQALIKHSGCDFTISVRPRVRSWVELEAGSLDMVASGIQTIERDQFAWFAPYLLDKKFVLLGPKIPESIKTIKQFLAEPKLSLGGVRSFKYGPFYDNFIDTLDQMHRMQKLNDTDTVYRMFARGRFDATIASPLAYRYYLKAYPPNGKVRFMNWDLGEKSVSSLVLSKKSFTEEQARQWQALISTLIANGTILNILSKHLGAEEARETLYQAPSPKTAIKK